MGTHKLLSDEKVNFHPYYDDGVLKVDRTRKRKKLNATERKLFADQVLQYYCIKYHLTPKELSDMQALWESPRSVRRRACFSRMQAKGFRKCAC